MDDSQSPAPVQGRNLWSPFAYRDFWLLWTGGVAMSITQVLRTLVSTQWLYDTTGSAAQIGLLGLVQFAQMPVVLYGGALADLFDRKKLMVITQGVTFGLLAALWALSATGNLQPWHIFVVTGLSSIANLLGASTRPAMLPRVVPREMLTRAVTVQVVSRQVSMVAAPILFWKSYDILGVTPSFAIASGIALASTLAPLFMKVSGQPERGGDRRTFRSFMEGFRFIKGHRLLPGLYALDIGVVVLTFYRPLFPVFADRFYGLGAEGTGPLNAADAAGGILGTLLVLYTEKFSRKGLLVLSTTVVFAVLLFAFATVRVFAVGLAIVAALGAMDAVSATTRVSIVQITTPDKLLGRATSFHSFAAMGGNSLGQAQVGMMVALIGAANAMLLGAALSLGVIAAVWRFIPGVRRYRYDPQHPYEKYEETPLASTADVAPGKG